MINYIAYVFIGVFLAGFGVPCRADNPTSDHPTSDQIENLIATHDIRTIEQLLKLLPKDYLSQYALIYRSYSMHQATFLNPRVVVFGANADFIAAFNDGETQGGYYMLDTMELDHDTFTYVPGQIQFSPKGTRRATYDRNPQSCILCHSSTQGQIQAIRTSYLGGVFPGLYGSINDDMTPAEGRHFEGFKQQTRQHGRYSYLPPLTKPPKWPALKPNTILGYLLNRNFHEWLTRYLNTKLELKPFGYAILAALECAPQMRTQKVGWDVNFEHYVDHRHLKNFKKTMQSYLNDIWERQNSFREEALRIRDSILDEHAPQSAMAAIKLSGEKTTGSFLYFVDQLLPEQNDSELLRRVLVNEDDQYGGLLNLARSYYKTALDPESDAELLKLHRDFDKSAPEFGPFNIASKYGKKICGELKTRSLQKLAETQ